jgi:hypothetical protein
MLRCLKFKSVVQIRCFEVFVNKKTVLLGAGLILSAILTACPGPKTEPIVDDGTLTGELGKSSEMLDNLIGLAASSGRIIKEGTDKATSVAQASATPAIPMTAMAKAFTALAAAGNNPGSAAQLVAKATQEFVSNPFPKGVFVCSTQNQCTKTESDDLKITWKIANGKTAVAEMDYTGSVKILVSKSTPPTTTFPGAPAPAEPVTQISYVVVPTQIVGTLSVDGTLVAALNFEGVTQAADAAGVSAGFSSIKLSGKLLELDGSKTILEIPSLTYSIDATGIKTKGEIRYNNNDIIVSKWDVTLGGEVDAAAAAQAAASNYYFNPLLGLMPVGFMPKGAGSIYFSNEVNNERFATSFKITDWNYRTSGSSTIPVSVNVTDGKLLVKGKLATFSGTFGEDTNRNCVPGEDLNMVFSDGNKTLEQFLISSGQIKACN